MPHALRIGLNPILALVFVILAGRLSAKTNQIERLFIPGLDRASQSNVVVTVCEWNGGLPCPVEYVNVLSNTNLFTSKQRKLIEDVFVKYRNVTTNSGPPGTEFIGLHKTNHTRKALDKTFEVTNWVARFQYTNSDAQEEVAIGTGISAKFRTKATDGYNMFFVRTGNGTMLRFTEIKQGLINGILVEFEDLHPQGTNWSFRLADFSDSRPVEYRQYTNGLVFGKFLRWNPRDGRLLVDADFKEPYDWNKNYRPPSPR